MYIIGAILLVSVGTWWLVKKHSDSASSESDSTSQLPADNAAANYSVPPDIGMSVDNTGGANFPQGENGYTYTVGQAQSLPTT
jgi:ABC-type nickel/cobalt efflux system permease component RcnA